MANAIELHTEETWLKVIAAYYSLGTVAKAAKALKMSPDSIYTYRRRNKDAWDQELARLRALTLDEHTSRYIEICNLTFSEIVDRVKHGDLKPNKDGELVRVPVPANVLGVIGGIYTDKLRIGMGQPTSISGKPADSKTLDILERMKQATMPVSDQIGVVVRETLSPEQSKH